MNYLLEICLGMSLSSGVFVLGAGQGGVGAFLLFEATGGSPLTVWGVVSRGFAG